MHWQLRFLTVLLIAALALGVGAVGWADDDDDDDDQALPFSEIQFFFELNDTDEDLGIQLNLGAEPWNKLRIEDPNGKLILKVDGKGDLKKFGLSQLFFESNEPSFDELSKDEILELFPPGEYEFEGRTIEGDKLEGTAMLSHRIPDAPVICVPEDGDVVEAADLVVEWKAVTTPAGVDIASYQVIVTNEGDSSFTYDVRLPADATCVSVPVEFLAPDTEYELEVLAVDANGNQTITVLFFCTEED